MFELKWSHGNCSKGMIPSLYLHIQWSEGCSFISLQKESRICFFFTQKHTKLKGFFFFLLKWTIVKNPFSIQLSYILSNVAKPLTFYSFPPPHFYPCHTLLPIHTEDQIASSADSHILSTSSSSSPHLCLVMCHQQSAKDKDSTWWCMLICSVTHTRHLISLEKLWTSCTLRHLGVEK